MKRLWLAAFSVAATLVLGEVVLRATGFGLVAPELHFGVNARNALYRGELVLDKDLFWTLPLQRTFMDDAIGAVRRLRRARGWS